MELKKNTKYSSIFSHDIVERIINLCELLGTKTLSLLFPYSLSVVKLNQKPELQRFFSVK